MESQMLRLRYLSKAALQDLVKHISDRMTDHAIVYCIDTHVI